MILAFLSIILDERAMIKLLELPENAKKEVKERVIKSLKPNVFKEISMNEIEEIINEAIKGVTSIDLAAFINDPSPFCDRCGECCRVSDPIIIKERELEIIALYLGIEIDIARANFTKESKGHLLSLKTKPCIFLKGKECSIYEVRPMICRQFPITKGEDGNLTLGWYHYCKVPINMAAFKTLGFIMKKIIEKTDPILSKAFEKWAESHIHLREGQQADQINAFIKFFREHEAYFDKKERLEKKT